MCTYADTLAVGRTLGRTRAAARCLLALAPWVCTRAGTLAADPIRARTRAATQRLLHRATWPGTCDATLAIDRTCASARAARRNVWCVGRPDQAPAAPRWRTTIRVRVRGLRHSVR